MTWDSVPWFVGGGAEHSPEVARLLAYAATGGAEGVVGITDLRVSTLDVPGGAVRVLPGAALIRTRGDESGRQSYVGRLPVADSVQITATGSSAGRSDLIIAQIEDPFVAGEPWQAPADPTAGPYVFTRVIPNVPAGTTRLQSIPAYAGRSAITLARIDIPASTGTITAGMIKDVRKVAQPRRQTELVAFSLITGQNEILTSASAYPGGENFPNAFEGRSLVEIPEWATRMKIVMTWSSLVAPAGNAWGRFWVQVGTDASKTFTQDVGWDTPGASGNTRMNFIAADNLAVPASYRGTSQRFLPRGNVLGGANSARMYVDAVAAMVLQVEFYETAA